MEGEKVFAVKFADCPCGKPDCPIRDALKNYMERMAAQQGLEKEVTQQMKDLKEWMAGLAEKWDEPPLVECDLHIPSLERVAAVRVRASEREVAKAIFRAAGEGANELKIKTKYVDASVRINLIQEGYIVRDDGDDWVEIRW